MSPPAVTRLGPRLLSQRSREVHLRIGSQIGSLRVETGVSRPELARCAGIAPSYLWKIERGAAEPSVQVLLAIGHCLGADLGVRFFPGTGPRLHDRFQAPMIEALIRVLGPAWQAQPEVPVAAARGVIDLVLRHSDNGVVVACECHSELRRLELVLRRLAEKTDGLAGQLAGKEAGGDVSRLLLLRSTAETRSVARAFEATLAAAFPAKASEAIAALRGEGPWPGATILWARFDRGRAEVLDAPPRGIKVGR